LAGCLSISVHTLAFPTLPKIGVTFWPAVKSTSLSLFCLVRHPPVPNIPFFVLSSPSFHASHLAFCCASKISSAAVHCRSNQQRTRPSIDLLFALLTTAAVSAPRHCPSRSSRPISTTWINNLFFAPLIPYLNNLLYALAHFLIIHSSLLFVSSRLLLHLIIHLQR
jgi:hypothetical protein